MLKAFSILVSLVSLANAQPAFPTDIIVMPNTNGIIKLQWEANLETNIIGYKVYIGTNSEAYNTNIFVNGGQTTNYTLRGIGTGIFFVALTAVDNTELESKFSNEVRVSLNNVRPSAPNTLKTGKILGSFYSSRYPTGPWELIAGTEKLILADEQAQFFRSSVEIVQGPEITSLKGK